MSYYGYHRTSTTEQHLDRGIAAITEYCQKNDIVLDVVFTDQQTGKNFNRPDYLAMKRVAKAGDIIIISELDRLGRNKADTVRELQYYKEHNIRLMILEIPTTLTDYSTMADDTARLLLDMVNNLVIEVYATIAETEQHKREKRQREGIEAKKARGEWSDYGRPKAIDYDTFASGYRRVVSGDMKPFECMRQLGMTKPTFYRYKKRYEQEQ